MFKYNVELDGVSIVQLEEELTKGDSVAVHTVGEVNYYRVGKVEVENLTLKMLKTVEPEEEGVKYLYQDEEYIFGNRLSKNQLIKVKGKLNKVVNIEKKTNILTLEEQELKEAYTLYCVYESKSEEGKTVRDRGKDSYSAEACFTDWKEAVRYVQVERTKGRKVSL